MEEKISIIIPVYNNEKYIDKCVGSVLKQTYHNWELILIDDGSTDNSLFLCERYKNDERVRVIKQRNKGVSTTRNNGLKLATGKYVTFIDSDDMVESGYCSRLLSFMKDDVSMVVLGLKRLKSDGSYKVLSHRLKGGYYSFDELKETIIDDGTASGFTLHSSCSILYRKDLIEQNSLSFDSDIKYNEDGLFNTLYFLSAKKSIYVNYDIAPYVYIENCRSASHTVDLTSDSYEKNRQLIEEKLYSTKNVYLSYDNLSIQLKRRRVTLFLGEARYALRVKRANYKVFKILIEKYNVKENIPLLRFSIMKKSKCVLFAFLRLRLYFFVYYFLKIMK